MALGTVCTTYTRGSANPLLAPEAQQVDLNGVERLGPHDLVAAVGLE